MRTDNRYLMLSRAALAVIAVLVVVAGVTFAALQSQAAVLRGNSIQTAVASLQLSSDGTNYSSQIDGYAFSNLIPGGQPMPNTGYPVYLKNVGTTPLALKLSVGGTLSNINQADLSKVHVIVSPISGGAPQNMLLSDLVTANSTGGVNLTQAPRITAGQSAGFYLQVMLDADAVSGPSAAISNLDFNFGAVAIN